MQQILKDLSKRQKTERIDAVYTEDIARTIVLNMGLSHAARENGLITLDEIITKDVYANNVCTFLMENTDLLIKAVQPELLDEIIVNKYFSNNMDIKDGLLYCLCGRGCLAIQQGLSPVFIRELLISIVPGYLRDEAEFYIIQYENELLETVDEMLHEIRRENLNKNSEYDENKDRLEELYDSMK